MKNIILIGAPGSGKGTQAFGLKEKYGLDHIATGDLFRAAIKNETKLGLEVKSILASGKFVNDELTLSIVEEALNNSQSSGFMLDGFPRTIKQAEMLNGLGIKIDAVLYFNIDESLLLDRLTGRRVCKDCGASYHLLFNKSKVDGVCDLCGGELFQRPDDNEEKVKVRLDEFYNNTMPVIDYYKQMNLLHEIDASASVEHVQSCISSIFMELK